MEEVAIRREEALSLAQVAIGLVDGMPRQGIVVLAAREAAHHPCCEQRACKSLDVEAAGTAFGYSLEPERCA